MKLREVLAAVEEGLARGELAPIDPDEVPKEVRTVVATMNRLIEHAARLERECRLAEGERDRAFHILRAVADALPVSIALADTEGILIAASPGSESKMGRRTVLPGTDGVTLAVGAPEAEASAVGPYEAGLAALTDGLNHLAAGDFNPIPLDGPGDPLACVKRAFNRAVQSVAEMIAVRSLFGERGS